MARTPDILFLNLKYPGSVPLQPFHSYITFNQIWTDHYYNAYPTAASNDVKAAQRVKDGLEAFIGDTKNASPDDFKKKYDGLLYSLQNDLSLMAHTPIVSLAAAAVEIIRYRASYVDRLRRALATILEQVKLAYEA